ncbi:hypothetical protein HDU76_001567, partial [Blyttiomyces sp. JEL0837]
MTELHFEEDDDKSGSCLSMKDDLRYLIPQSVMTAVARVIAMVAPIIAMLVFVQYMYVQEIVQSSTTPSSKGTIFFASVIYITVRLQCVVTLKSGFTWTSLLLHLVLMVNVFINCLYYRLAPNLRTIDLIALNIFMNAAIFPFGLPLVPVTKDTTYVQWFILAAKFSYGGAVILWSSYAILGCIADLVYRLNRQIASDQNYTSNEDMNLRVLSVFVTGIAYPIVKGSLTFMIRVLPNWLDKILIESREKALEAMIVEFQFQSRQDIFFSVPLKILVFRNASFQLFVLSTFATTLFEPILQISIMWLSKKRRERSKDSKVIDVDQESQFLPDISIQQSNTTLSSGSFTKLPNFKLVPMIIKTNAFKDGHRIIPSSTVESATTWENPQDIEVEENEQPVIPPYFRQQTAGSGNRREVKIIDPSNVSQQDLGSKSEADFSSTQLQSQSAPGFQLKESGKVVTKAVDHVANLVSAKDHKHHIINFISAEEMMGVSLIFMGMSELAIELVCIVSVILFFSPNLAPWSSCNVYVDDYNIIIRPFKIAKQTDMRDLNNESNQTVDPFTYYGKPVRGKPWIIPPESILPALPPGVGYGCFQNPNSSFGYSLADPTNVTSVLDSCGPGFFCPYLDLDNVFTLPVVCPADDVCQYRRLNTLRCLPQGRYEPMVCPPGFYCPDYKTVLPCPEGNYCLSGSTAPKPCLPNSFCEIGTVNQSHYGLIIYAIILDILLYIAVLIVQARNLRRAGLPVHYHLLKLVNRLRRRKQNQPTSTGDKQLSVRKGIPSIQADTEDNKETSVSSEIETKDPEVSHHIQDNSVLVPAFRKGSGGSENNQINFDFDNMGLELKSGRKILEGVTGRIQSGRMTAILGASGAGKTTFMNVLMGKIKRTSGDLKINGVVSEMESLRKIIGYVPQEDYMLREMTVRENILYSARVRLPSSWSKKEVEDHVDNIIKVLNLTHVAHNQVGDEMNRGISGGQRKRVSIAMELAAVPVALFLDEPTSGLDSTAALDVADILKSISRLGLTIVSVIHQPRSEIFDRFDDVLLIAPGGRTAYLGPVSNVKPYFESLGFLFPPDVNSADVLMDILAGRGVIRPDFAGPRITVDEITKSWIANEKTTTSKATSDENLTSSNKQASIDTLRAVSRLRGAGFSKQLFLVIQRSITQQSRTFSSLFFEFVVAMLTGFFLGYGLQLADDDSYSGIVRSPNTPISAAPRDITLSMYTMLIGISIVIASAPAGVNVFGEERMVYFREAAAGHDKL